MSKNIILILANSAGGLLHFRQELIEELIRNNFIVYFSVPNLEDDISVQKLLSLKANYIYTNIDRRGINPFKDFKLINEYKRILKKINPDIILTYTVKPNIYGNYVANKFNIPVIMNVTGIGTSLISHKLKFLIKTLYKYACSKSNTVFFQNSNNKDFFLQNKLVDKEKTKLIPGSGVNLTKFVPLEKTKKDEKIKFLFIGRLMKEKGIDELFEVYKAISAGCKNVLFQIVGSFEEEKYKILLESTHNVEFLGRSQDVREQIKEADCIINPSYHEGMSNVLLEGAAMGKPLLASNIPGCKEIVVDSYNGFLFEPKSASSLEASIIKFIELTDEERVIMGKNSRIKVEKEFDRNIVINEYMKVIKNICNKDNSNETVI
jgi:glycosyltransferase involved in cell wall biosynthesis